MPAFPDGAPALTACLLGWTGGEQWPAFARSPEARDRFPDPLNRWSKQAIESIAGPLVATAVYPFDFQRWVLKAEGRSIARRWVCSFTRSGDSGTRIAGRLPCAGRSNLRPARAPQIRAKFAATGRAFWPARSPPSRRSAPTTTPRAVVSRSRRRGLPDPNLPLSTYILCGAASSNMRHWQLLVAPVGRLKMLYTQVKRQLPRDYTS